MFAGFVFIDGIRYKNMKHTVKIAFGGVTMAKVHFNLDSKKYIMEFLPDNQVKIIQTGNEDKVIVVQYFSDTKVTDFMKCIKSLNFSKLKDNELYTLN